MSDEVNKNPLPRIIKGTGYYTPMDLAPGEKPASNPAESAPMTTPPPTPVTTPVASKPAQNSEGDKSVEGN